MRVCVASSLPILFSGILLSASVFAQSSRSVELAQPGTFICNYTGATVNPNDICTTSIPSNGHAERVVDRILKPIGLMRNFKVMECSNTDNCFATVLKGQRFIIYDAAFMQQIEEETETDWSAISIMAHEIGHHLQGHTIDGKGGQPQKEIEADRFSGFVLHQLGASLEDATIAVRTLGDEHATSTHPAKPTRIEAIRKGWLEAEAMYPKGKTDVKTPATVASKSITTTRPAVTERAVIAPASAPARAKVGCLSGNCQQGNGVLVYPTGERYVGEFNNGDKQGEGIEYYADGKLKYKGSFRNNLRSDYGVYFYRNGDKYMGWFENNMPNGKGTYYFADGERYSGVFRNGQPAN